MKIVAQTDSGFLLSATAQEISDIGYAGRVDARPVPAPTIGQTVDPLARINSLVERLAGTESALRQSRLAMDDAVAPRPEGTGKTDMEIVNEVNALAGILMRQAGYEVLRVSAAPGGRTVVDVPVQYWNHKSPRCQKAWAQAVEIYEHLFATEVHDALLSVQDAEAA